MEEEKKVVVRKFPSAFFMDLINALLLVCVGFMFGFILGLNDGHMRALEFLSQALSALGLGG